LKLVAEPADGQQPSRGGRFVLNLLPKPTDVYVDEAFVADVVSSRGG
jgi:hypothetical protein